MLDLPSLILKELEAASETTSQELALKLKVDVQRVVGAIKSLEALGDVVSSEMYQCKKWGLTEEGQEVLKEGSHEARLYNLVPPTGINQPDLMAKCGAWGKIGFNKAMSAGWIYLQKTKVQGPPVVMQKVDNITDSVASHLAQIKAGQEAEVVDKLKAEYRKRKLVEELTEKHYKLRKGTGFTTTIKKAPTELTPEMISSGSWKTTKLKPYNLDALGVQPEAGCLHPLLKVRTEYRQIFLEMGFTEMPANNFVESSFWNFDALFQPQQHPARDAHDTFFISDPATSDNFPADYKERVEKVHSKGGFGSQGYGYEWKVEEASKNLLRTHTTAVSARMLYKAAQQPKFSPQKLFSIDRVFRNETLDQTHLAEFHQIEGVVADYGLTLGHCIGVINTFFLKLGIEKLRFKPAYNPYTEPSMEIFSFHEGLNKWVEIGNSGMFRPEMLLPMGLPKGVNCIGFGLSLERPTMIKYKIDNIRSLCGHKVDLDMVKNNPICRIDKAGSAEERLVQMLNKRYDKIESKLDFLSQKLKSLGLKGANASQAGGGGSLANKTNEVIVRVHPSRPAHSLAVLASLLSNRFNVATSTYTHSSVDRPGSLRLAESEVRRTEADLRLTLIYTDVMETTSLVNGTKEIKGEGNLCRYLVRLLDTRTDSGLYETNQPSEVDAIDQVLDRLSDVSKHGVTTTVSALLSKQNFLATNKPSVADILAISLCEQQKVQTPAIKTWKSRVQSSLG